MANFGHKVRTVIRVLSRGKHHSRKHCQLVSPGQMGNGFIGRWPPYISPHVVQTGEFGLAYRRLCELEFGHFKTCLQSKITHTLLCIFKCGLLSLSIYTCQVN